MEIMESESSGDPSDHFMTRRELKGVIDYRKGQRCGFGLAGNLVMNSPIIRPAVSVRILECE